MFQFTTGAEERTAIHDVESGQVYDLEVRFSNFKPLSPQSPYVSRTITPRWLNLTCRLVAEVVSGSAVDQSNLLKTKSPRR
jgi:hypothetical protein